MYVRMYVQCRLVHVIGIVFLMGYWVQVFSLILDSSFGSQWAFILLEIRFQSLCFESCIRQRKSACLYFYSKIVRLCLSIEINNNHVFMLCCVVLRCVALRYVMLCSRFLPSSLIAQWAFSLCLSIQINNKHVNRQSQVRKATGSGVEWAECSLIIGTRNWVPVFSLILESSVDFLAGIQSAGDSVPETLGRRKRICFLSIRKSLACVIDIYDNKHVCISLACISARTFSCMYIRPSTPVCTYVCLLMWFGRGLDKIGAGS